jgi:hypothetical protein
MNPVRQSDRPNVGHVDNGMQISTPGRRQGELDRASFPQLPYRHRLQNSSSQPDRTNRSTRRSTGFSEVPQVIRQIIGKSLINSFLHKTEIEGLVEKDIRSGKEVDVESLIVKHQLDDGESRFFRNFAKQEQAATDAVNLIKNGSVVDIEEVIESTPIKSVSTINYLRRAAAEEDVRRGMYKDVNKAINLRKVDYPASINKLRVLAAVLLFKKQRPTLFGRKMSIEEACSAAGITDENHKSRVERYIERGDMV